MKNNLKKAVADCDSKTLHLNLKKKWFEMILYGYKREEYREIKKHWVKQLVEPTDEEVTISDVIYYLNGGELDHFKNNSFKFKDFDTITFSNGYAKDRPQFVIELKGIEIKTGSEKWGAEPYKKYFVLILGDILRIGQQQYVDACRWLF